MTIAKITIIEELGQFIKQYAEDYYSLQLILFFADHPYTRFNGLAIIHALSQNGRKRCPQKALGDLVDKGIIKTYTDSNVILYSLSENIRSLALELTKLDWFQRQLLLRQTCPNTDVVRKGYRPF